MAWFLPPVAATLVWVLIVRRGRGTRSVRRTLRGAVFGAVLVTVLAAAQIAVYRHELRTNDAIGAKPEVAATVVAVVVHLTVVPVAAWAGFRLLGVRPAWVATLGAWGLLGSGALLIAQAGKWPATQIWVYGVLGLVTFAAAAAGTAGVVETAARSAEVGPEPGPQNR